ncbi:hypothetical protein F4776DRAFT_661743 [Hypoxylon sp. NC0597]|nr:hypothetical protein F4776DRAFT_661743 [Hypoxylon sp. NC0597]
MDSGSPDLVSRARDHGNSLYRSGNLLKAEQVYSHGARLAPQDIRFPANLSSVKFEMGNYSETVSCIEKALSLVDPQTDTTMVQKLYVRLVKAYLLSYKFNEAREAISHITTEQDRRALGQSLRRMEAVQSLYRDEKTLWNQVIQRLPRYRPKLADDVEFSAVGRDVAGSVFHSSLADSNQEDYSFLFPNVGDARDVFATLADIGKRSSTKYSLTFKKFYFTLVDLKSAAFARDLLMFRMLADYAAEPERDRRVTLATLSYTFAAHIMPSWAYDRLQTAIHRVMDEIQRNVPLIIGNFYIDATTRDSISNHLLNWQEPPTDWYGTEGILNSTRQQHAEKERIKNGRRADIVPETIRGVTSKTPPPECEPDSLDTLAFLDLSFMLPSALLMREYEPELAELIMEYGFEAGVSITGQSMIDSYHASRRNDSLPNVNFTPQEVVRDLFWHFHHRNVAPDCRGAFEHLMGFFSFVGKWYHKIRGQTMFRMVIDDVANFMELREKGLLSREHPAFPDRYDKIHMSHIPDYAGGPLTVFLHGMPILRHDKASEITFTIALNQEQWATREQLLVEHFLLADRPKTTETFATTLTENPFYIDDVISGGPLHSDEPLMKCPLSWSRTSYEPLAWAKLMPRQELERWLHMHFLKLCLPFPRIDTLSHSVFTLSNTIMFFRLLMHLSRVGYPLHWLSEVLASMCNGEITSQARAPRAKIMDKAEVERKYSKRKISIRPFVEEFKTLLVIWRRLLPFNLLQDESRLPPIETIREYRLRFTWPETLTSVYHPVITLVLWNVDDNGAIPRHTLREALRDDEKTNPKYKGISRQNGRVHVISTVKFNSVTKTASFWFADAPIQGMVSADSHWEAYIFDTNTWVVLSEPVPVNRSNLAQGNVWCHI